MKEAYRAGADAAAASRDSDAVQRPTAKRRTGPVARPFSAFGLLLTAGALAATGESAAVTHVAAVSSLGYVMGQGPIVPLLVNDLERLGNNDHEMYDSFIRFCERQACKAIWWMLDQVFSSIEHDASAGNVEPPASASSNSNIEVPDVMYVDTSVINWPGALVVLSILVLASMLVAHVLLCLQRRTVRIAISVTNSIDASRMQDWYSSFRLSRLRMSSPTPSHTNDAALLSAQRRIEALEKALQHALADHGTQHYEMTAGERDSGDSLPPLEEVGCSHSGDAVALGQGPIGSEATPDDHVTVCPINNLSEESDDDSNLVFARSIGEGEAHDEARSGLVDESSPVTSPYLLSTFDKESPLFVLPSVGVFSSLSQHPGEPPRYAVTPVEVSAEIGSSDSSLVVRSSEPAAVRPSLFDSSRALSPVAEASLSSSVAENVRVSKEEAPQESAFPETRAVPSSDKATPSTFAERPPRASSAQGSGIKNENDDKSSLDDPCEPQGTEFISPNELAAPTLAKTTSMPNVPLRESLQACAGKFHEARPRFAAGAQPVQRAVTAGSDVCRVSSPPSTASDGITQAAAREVLSPAAQSVQSGMRDSVPTTSAPQGQGVRPATACLEAPSEPVGYKVERGARIPIYKTENPEAAERVPASSAHDTANASDRRKPLAVEEQCCECGEVFPILPTSFFCPGMVAADVSGEQRVCDNFACPECLAALEVRAGIGKRTVCSYQHLEDDEGETLTGIPYRPPTLPAPLPPKDPMLTLLSDFKEAIVDLGRSRGETGAKTQFRSSAVLAFPKGSKQALMDLDQWLREFDRVIAHVSNNTGLTAQDRITHLLASWPLEGETKVAGKELRYEQESEDYSRLEKAGNFEACCLRLLNGLKRCALQPVEARRNAQQQWNSWKWQGDIRNYNLDAREAARACARQNIPKADHDVVLRYLEMLPPECAIFLEDRLRVPAEGWTFSSVQEAALEYFQTRAAYSDNHTGGLRQRANWSSDRKQMEAFGGGDSKPPTTPSGPQCGRCRGFGHSQENCPNQLSAKDESWKSKDKGARE